MERIYSVVKGLWDWWWVTLDLDDKMDLIYVVGLVVLTVVMSNYKA